MTDGCIRGDGRVGAPVFGGSRQRKEGQINKAETQTEASVIQRRGGFSVGDGAPVPWEVSEIAYVE